MTNIFSDSSRIKTAVFAQSTTTGKTTAAAGKQSKSINLFEETKTDSTKTDNDKKSVRNSSELIRSREEITSDLDYLLATYGIKRNFAGIDKKGGGQAPLYTDEEIQSTLKDLLGRVGIAKMSGAEKGSKPEPFTEAEINKYIDMLLGMHGILRVSYGNGTAGRSFNKVA